MKKMNVFLVAVFTLLFSVSFAQNYKADVQKSQLQWTGKKVTGEHHGTINLSSGEFSIVDDQIKSGTFAFDMTSIVCLDLENETYNKKLVGHLKSDDFFSVEKYPTVIFKITESQKVDNNSQELSGDLTIKGITHLISIKVVQSAYKGVLKFEGLAIVDRTKYNIKYGSGKFYEALGDNMIYDEFELKFTIVATK